MKKHLVPVINFFRGETSSIPVKEFFPTGDY
jgi:hypothetical protein